VILFPWRSRIIVRTSPGVPWRAELSPRTFCTCFGISSTARDVTIAIEPLLERLTFEQLHRDERRIGADVVDGADVGVVER
jgi:hypothetical protein